MTAPLPFFRSGETLTKSAPSAATWNALVSAARRALRSDPALNVRREIRDMAVISVVNRTGEPLDRFMVVGVGDATFDPSLSQVAESELLTDPTFEAVFPPTNAHRGRFAVLLDSIGITADYPDEAIAVGLARTAGLVYVLVADDVVAGDAVDIDEDSRASEGILEVVSGGTALVLWVGEITTELPAYTRLALARIGGGGGGQNQSIDFIVDGWVPDDPTTSGCDAVYATVTQVSCGASVRVGDQVIIYDPRLCWFNLPAQILIGLEGTAVWMESFYTDYEGDINFCRDVPLEGECMWVVKSLCCVEELYAT